MFNFEILEHDTYFQVPYSYIYIYIGVSSWCYGLNILPMEFIQKNKVYLRDFKVTRSCTITMCKGDDFTAQVLYSLFYL